MKKSMELFIGLVDSTVFSYEFDEELKVAGLEPACHASSGEVP